MPNHPTVELPVLALGPAQPMQGRALAPPLRGITILAVEDSRFASEALRLMCNRLGARLRRAETLSAAQSHLRLYRPDLVIVDLGLPDGRGEALIREIVLRNPRGPVILGTSGDAAGRASALAAGADGFLDKPLESFTAFRTTIARHLPDPMTGPPDAPDTPLTPDTLALRDDLAHAAALIEAGTDAAGQAYVTGFLSGVARHAHDAALAEAVLLGQSRDGNLTQLAHLLRDRLNAPAPAFASTPQGR